MVGRGRPGAICRPRIVLLATTLLAGGVLVAAGPLLGESPLRWGVAVTIPTVAWAGYVWWRLGGMADPLTGALGAANAVTIVRGFLVCSVAGFVVSRPTWAWLPALLFGIAVVLDAVDGAVARRTTSTRLGARLDRSVDGLTILVGATAAIALGGLPAWYLLAGVVWYGYVAGLALRARRGHPVYGLPPSRLRGPIGSVQYLVIAGGLTPLAPHPAVTAAAGAALVVLLASFFRDWLAATAIVGQRAGQRLPAYSDD